jgi:hypothetical protein
MVTPIGTYRIAGDFFSDALVSCHRRYGTSRSPSLRYGSATPEGLRAFLHWFGLILVSITETVSVSPMADLFISLRSRHWRHRHRFLSPSVAIPTRWGPQRSELARPIQSRYAAGRPPVGAARTGITMRCTGVRVVADFCEFRLVRPYPVNATVMPSAVPGLMVGGYVTPICNARTWCMKTLLDVPP